jgi:hypothetical protein
MVGSPCLVDLAIAAGTIRAYAPRMCAQDQQMYGAVIHFLFTSVGDLRAGPNVLGSAHVSTNNLSNRLAVGRFSQP